jgi:hypothetical protein
MHRQYARDLDEHQAKAKELVLCHEEYNVYPEWFGSGEPPADWDVTGPGIMRRLRARKRIERYEYGTHGFVPIVAGSDGEITMDGDDDGWKPLPR